MRPSPLEADRGNVDAVTRLLRLRQPSVGQAESTQPHPIRLLAEIRHLIYHKIHTCVRRNKQTACMYVCNVCVSLFLPMFAMIDTSRPFVVDRSEGYQP